jgi:hypothetical protein
MLSNGTDFIDTFCSSNVILIFCLLQAEAGTALRERTQTATCGLLSHDKTCCKQGKHAQHPKATEESHTHTTSDHIRTLRTQIRSSRHHVRIDPTIVSSAEKVNNLSVQCWRHCGSKLSLSRMVCVTLYALVICSDEGRCSFRHASS